MAYSIQTESIAYWNNSSRFSIYWTEGYLQHSYFYLKNNNLKENSMGLCKIIKLLKLFHTGLVGKRAIKHYTCKLKLNNEVNGWREEVGWLLEWEGKK